MEPAFTYTILFAGDVARAADFYERAFGFGRRFASPTGDYIELETGAVTLAVVDREFVGRKVPVGAPARDRASFEIGIVVSDVPAAQRRAVEAGAELVTEPETTPWGQVIAYVRDVDGFLVEICTPVASP